MPIEHLLVVSDLHCGSTIGLMPYRHERRVAKTVIEGNPVQRWYWDQWQELADVWLPDVAQGVPYAIVYNGDLIDGNHHKTKEIVSPDELDHSDIAIRCCEYLGKGASASIVVEGTECHTKESEHNIAKALKAVGPLGGVGAWPRFDAIVGKHRVIAQHHISTSIRPWTEATGLGVALSNEQIEACRAGERMPTVLCSAHRHRPGLYQTSSGISLVTGAWQGLTRHGYKVVPSARCWVTAAWLDLSQDIPQCRTFERLSPRLAPIELSSAILSTPPSPSSAPASRRPSRTNSPSRSPRST